MKEVLPGIRLVVAPNPSPMTLEGTNTWIVGGWVVDPGPAIPAHLDAVVSAAHPLQGIVLTHSHADHSEGAGELGLDPILPSDGDRVGPFSAIATPGHSADSVCLLHDRVLFTGDTVLGEGSVFISPGEGSLGAYLDSLERLLALDLDAICPGHGPVVRDPAAKLREYRDHRLEREAKVIAALEAGARTQDELLDRAWADVDFSVSPIIRAAAGATLAAHLEKLSEEGRLPADVAPDALAGSGFADA